MPRSTCSCEELKKFLRRFSERFPQILDFCTKVLESKRYNGNVILMIVDAGMTSNGVNYFSVVIPRVLKFRERFLLTEEISGLEDLASRDIGDFFEIWKNKRCWEVVKEVSKALLEFGDGVKALRDWASSSSFPSWRDDPLAVRGVGINTFQYLRMMGGVDTVMPDRIVRSFLSKFYKIPDDPVEFILFAERKAKEAGFRAVDLCWIAWLSKYDEERLRKYSDILQII